MGNIKQKTIPDGYEMVFFDFKSLFMNLPLKKLFT